MLIVSVNKSCTAVLGYEKKDNYNINLNIRNIFRFCVFLYFMNTHSISMFLLFFSKFSYLFSVLINFADIILFYCVINSLCKLSYIESMLFFSWTFMKLIMGYPISFSS